MSLYGCTPVYYYKPDDGEEEKVVRAALVVFITIMLMVNPFKGLEGYLVYFNNLY